MNFHDADQHARLDVDFFGFSFDRAVCVSTLTGHSVTTFSDGIQLQNCIQQNRLQMLHWYQKSIDTVTVARSDEIVGSDTFRCFWTSVSTMLCSVESVQWKSSWLFKKKESIYCSSEYLGFWFLFGCLVEQVIAHLQWCSDYSFLL